MIDPAGNMLTRNGTISATPTTGLFTYSFIDGDIPLSGKYSVQCIISMSTGNQYSTTIAYFRAGGVLASKNPPGVAFIALQPLLSCVVSQSLTLQTGVITLTAAAGMSLAIGQFMNVIYEGDNTQWMEGTVLGYNAQTGFLSIDVINFAGSGTYSDWLVCISSAYSAGSTDDARNAEIYKNQAFDYMTTAAGSASAAGLSATAAADSATAAADSATAAGLSETAAGLSETAAANSASAAANSASAAGLSETAAANSATAASGSATAASGSATAAADSAASASTYSRVRLSSTTYPLRAVVIALTLANNLYLQCTTAGTTASVAPSGISTMVEGSTITDGTVVWTAITIAPLTSPAFIGTPTAPTPAQFDASTQIANTSFVQRALGNLCGAGGYAVNTTLTVADIGKIIELSLSGMTATLPSSATIGSVIHFLNVSGGNVTIAGAIFQPGQGSITSLTLAYTCTASFVWDSAHWIEYSANQFGNKTLLGASGYMRLGPLGGLTLEWGTISSVAAGSTPVTLPLAFSTACVYANAVGSNSNGSTNNAALTTAKSTTAFTFYMNYGVTITTVDWIALGY